MRTIRKMPVSVCLLAAGALVLSGPAGIFAGPASSPAAHIHGAIYSIGADANGRAPVAGALIAAIETATGEAFESGASAADGTYRLGDLPPGTYALAVRTGTDVYLSDDLVGLAAGDERAVSFALEARAADEGTDDQEGMGEGDETSDADEDDEAKPGAGKVPSSTAKTGTFFSNHPWLAGLTVAGSAFAVGAGVDALTDDNKPIEKKASP